MKLLVTYDGSPASTAAFPVARKLSQATAAEVVLLRVFRPPLGLVAHPDAEHREAQLQAIERSYLDELQQSAKSIGEEVRPIVRRLGQRWNLVDEILAVATEFGADFICMATHGESAFRHFVVGSTALDVLSKSPCPVVLVRSDLPAGAGKQEHSDQEAHRQNPAGPAS